MALKGSKTEGNLKAAFSGESQANRRYLYFAQKADIEGYFIIPESDVIDEMRIVVSVDNEINIIADTEKKLKVIANHYTSSKI